MQITEVVNDSSKLRLGPRVLGDRQVLLHQMSGRFRYEIETVPQSGAQAS